MNDLKKANDFAKFVKSNMGMFPMENFGVDVYSRLFDNRIIFLNTDLNDYTANLIKAQLLYLESISDEDIKLYIDSGGGSVYSSMGILDTIDLIKCDVETVNIGLAASMAAVLLSYGTKGKRKSLKRSKLMIHQPLSFAEGQASDLEINTKSLISSTLSISNISLLCCIKHSTFSVVVIDDDRNDSYSLYDDVAGIYVGVLHTLNTFIPSLSQRYTFLFLKK